MAEKQTVRGFGEGHIVVPMSRIYEKRDPVEKQRRYRGRDEDIARLLTEVQRRSRRAKQRVRERYERGEEGVELIEKEDLGRRRFSTNRGVGSRDAVIHELKAVGWD